MKIRVATRSAFLNRRLLISFELCLIALLLLLGVAFSPSTARNLAPDSTQNPDQIARRAWPPVVSAAAGTGSNNQAEEFSQTTGSSGPLVVPGSSGPLVVLYDQNNNAGSLSTRSQNFETSSDAFDDKAADDFVVPVGQTWTVQQVVVTGVYFNGPGPADSFNVFFYADSAGLPGTSVYRATNQSFAVAGNVFTINLTAIAVLSPGTYWVSVQANQDFNSAGQWAWVNRTVASNKGAAWQNPGGGLGNPCLSWGQRALTCNADPREPDQMFQLIGVMLPLCFYYGYSVSTGSIVPGTTDTGNHTDDGSTIIALPFSYRLYNSTFNQVAVASNGHLTFGTVNDDWNLTCIPIYGATYAIGPYWTDLCTGPCLNVTGENLGIFTSTSGTAPNRIFNIEWRAAYYNSNQTTNIPLNFEVRLYEGQTPDQFDMIYGTMQLTFTPPAHRNLTVGVQPFGQSGQHEGYTLVGCDMSGGGSPPVSSGQRYHFTLFGDKAGCPDATAIPFPPPPATPKATPTATSTPTATATPTPTPSCSGPGGGHMDGYVYYCSNPVPAGVPGVAIHWITVTFMTDSSGHYGFFNKGEGGWITCSKADLSPGSPGISTVDVIAVQRHFLVIGPPLSGCRLTAADVNGDASVNTTDVIAIQRFVLSFSTGTAYVGKYRFDPPVRCFVPEPNQNFDTLIFGDVAMPFIY